MYRATCRCVYAVDLRGRKGQPVNYASTFLLFVTAGVFCALQLTATLVSRHGRSQMVVIYIV